MKADREIAHCFNRLFAIPHNTVIIGGGVEPVYLPPRILSRGIIRYTRDHAASALHEIAHWCIAGPERRGQVDYGYWYVSPPRSQAQQEAFFTVEAHAQALELLFAEVAGVSFNLSVDDLSVKRSDERAPGNSLTGQIFAERVQRSVDRWRKQGLPCQAKRMMRAFGGTGFTS